MKNKPYIALFISIISVSFAAILIRTCDCYQTQPLSIAFYRLMFTTLIILPFVLIYSKTRSELLNIHGRTFIIMAIIGVILGSHFAFWITSLAKTSVASSVILVTAHPLLVGPVSHYFLKEKLSKINTLGIILAVVGVIVLVYGNKALTIETIDTLKGNILAILGGIAAGLYILGGRKVRKTVSIGSYALVVYATGTITLLIVSLFLNEPIMNLSLHDLGIIFLMAIVAGIFGHTLYNWSLGYIRASFASVVLLGEPIGSSVLAYIIPWISEIPSQYTIFGGAIILTGIYLTSKKK